MKAKNRSIALALLIVISFTVLLASMPAYASAGLFGLNPQTAFANESTGRMMPMSSDFAVSPIGQSETCFLTNIRGGTGEVYSKRLFLKSFLNVLSGYIYEKKLLRSGITAPDSIYLQDKLAKLIDPLHAKDGMK